MPDSCPPPSRGVRVSPRVVSRLQGLPAGDKRRLPTRGNSDQATLVGRSMSPRSPAPTAASLVEGTQERPAGRLAAPAGVGTNTAVFVHRRVALTLVAAAVAGGDASLEQRLYNPGVVAGLAAGDPESGGAHFDAVETQPDALDHLDHVRLGQIGIDVSNAGLQTI